MTRSGWWAVGSSIFLFGAFVVLAHRVLLAGSLALLGLLAAGSLSLLRRPDLAAHQTLSPPTIGVGERADAVLVTTNRGARATPPLLASNLIHGVPLDVEVPPLAPGESRRTKIQLPTDRRGVYTVGPLQIQQQDPLGLFSVTSHQGTPVSLTVHPEVHPMAPLPTGLRRELEGVATQRPQEGGISFHSLRPYVFGDDLRLVHWRSVARQADGQLMVRKNVVTSEPRLMVVLDTSSDPYDDESFEDAVRLAASLVHAGSESHYPVIFRTTGGLGGEIGPGGEGRESILTILAGVDRSSDDPGLAGIVRFAERVEGVSLGVVSGQPAEGLTAGISRVRGRFDMVTVLQVGESFDRPPLRIPGALVVNGADSAQVADRWQARFGS